MSTQKQVWTIIYDSTLLSFPVYPQGATGESSKHMQSIVITDEEYHYIAKVLRLQAGDEIDITNCQGVKSFGKIESITKKEVKVHILNSSLQDKFLPEIHLYLAMPKPSTLDEVVSAASEMGVDEIHIFRTEKCASKAPIKLDKLERMSKEAVRVSKSAFSAKVFYYNSLEELITKRKSYLSSGLNLFCDESHIYENKIQNSLLKIAQEKMTKQKPVHLIIGPEASFSDAEREFIHKNIECSDVSLGNNILRVPNAVCLGVGVLLQARELMDNKE